MMYSRQAPLLYNFKPNLKLTAITNQISRSRNDSFFSREDDEEFTAEKTQHGGNCNLEKLFFLSALQHRFEIIFSPSSFQLLHNRTTPILVHVQQQLKLTYSLHYTDYINAIKNFEREDPIVTITDSKVTLSDTR